MAPAEVQSVGWFITKKLFCIIISTLMIFNRKSWYNVIFLYLGYGNKFQKVSNVHLFYKDIVIHFFISKMSVYCSCNGRCYPNTANLTDRVLFCPEHSTFYKENCSYVCCRPKIKVTNLVKCNKCELIYAGILIPENSQNICY